MTNYNFNFISSQELFHQFDNNNNSGLIYDQQEGLSYLVKDTELVSQSPYPIQNDDISYYNSPSLILSNKHASKINDNHAVVHTHTATINDSMLGQSLIPCSNQPLFFSYSSSSIDSTSPGSRIEPNRKSVTNELKRQIHIQSEQKRRAQIKDGFEDLKSELPSYLNKKMSKVALLHKTVQHIQHLKNTQITILAELKRLANENEQLKKFQQDVLHKQTAI